MILRGSRHSIYIFHHLEPSVGSVVGDILMDMLINSVWIRKWFSISRSERFWIIFSKTRKRILGWVVMVVDEVAGLPVYSNHSNEQITKNQWRYMTSVGKWIEIVMVWGEVRSPKDCILIF